MACPGTSEDWHACGRPPGATSALFARVLGLNTPCRARRAGSTCTGVALCGGRGRDELGAREQAARLRPQPPCPLRTCAAGSGKAPAGACAAAGLAHLRKARCSGRIAKRSGVAAASAPTCCVCGVHALLLGHKRACWAGALSLLGSSAWRMRRCKQVRQGWLALAALRVCGVLASAASSDAAQRQVSCSCGQGLCFARCGHLQTPVHDSRHKRCGAFVRG